MTGGGGGDSCSVASESCRLYHKVRLAGAVKEMCDVKEAAVAP